MQSFIATAGVGSYISFAMDLYSSLQFFPSALASEMADIPEPTLRTWRKRGLMPEDRLRNDRFDSLQVCALAIRKAMISQGESPKDNIALARHSAPAVLYAAIRERPSLVSDDGGLSRQSAWSSSPAIQLRAMGPDEIVNAIAGHKEPAVWRYLVAVDDEPYQPASSLEGALSSEAVSLRCIDLHALGSKIAQLARAPLILLDRAGSDPQPLLRPKEAPP